MKKISNKFEKLYCILICINVILLNIFVGAIDFRPKVALEIIILLEAIIYIVVSKIKKKEHVLIKGKIDIAFLALVVITMIPLSLKTYASLSSTINLTFVYFTVYAMYVLVRNIITTPKRKSILINTMLVSSLVIVIFGIDRMNYYTFRSFYKLANLLQISDWRMSSTMGYANTVFIYMALLSIIALGKLFQTENKKIAGLYAVYIQLAMYGIYYGNSRAGIVIFAIVFLAYLIALKDINKAVKALAIMAFSYLSVMAFNTIKSEHCSNILIWVEIAATAAVTYVFCIIVLKIFEKVKIKTNKKKAIILIVTSVVILAIYFMLAKNISAPTNIDSDYGYVTLYNPSFNTEYSVTLDYSYDYTEPVTIEVVQIDNKRNQKTLYEDTVSKKGEHVTKEFTMQTTEPDYIMIRFIKYSKSRFTLNKILLNGKEEIVNYKYLPNDIMRLIKTFKLGNISVSERISMYRSGLKLFLLHPIVGNGGKSYANMYSSVREYAYVTKEVHSSHLDVLLDYGIIGFVAWLGILSITIYNFVKRKDKKDVLSISIFFGWLLIMTHTIFDFDLSYLLMLSVFYTLIALISKEDDKTIKYNLDIVDYIVPVIMGVMVIVNCIRLPGEKLFKEKKYDEALQFMFYDEENTRRYIFDCENIDETYIKIACNYLDNEKNDYQYNVLSKLIYAAGKLEKSGKQSEANEIKEKINQLEENNNILAATDVVLKEQWENLKEKIK